MPTNTRRTALDAFDEFTRTARPPFVSIAEAAEFWSVSRDAIRDAIAEGHLRPHRRGRMIRLDIAEVTALFTPTES